MKTCCHVALHQLPRTPTEGAYCAGDMESLDGRTTSAVEMACWNCSQRPHQVAGWNWLLAETTTLSWSHV